MDKQQILEHIRRIEEEERAEQLLQASAPETITTALVPISHQGTPSIVESTIVIETPLPDEEAEPISAMPVPRRRRGSLLLFTFAFILLFSIGLYFVLPILFPTATVTIVPMQKTLSTQATIHIAAQTNQPAQN